MCSCVLSHHFYKRDPFYPLFFLLSTHFFSLSTHFFRFLPTFFFCFLTTFFFAFYPLFFCFLPTFFFAFYPLFFFCRLTWIAPVAVGPTAAPIAPPPWPGWSSVAWRGPWPRPSRTGPRSSKTTTAKTIVTRPKTSGTRTERG